MKLIKKIINYILYMTSLIVLIMLIYAGYGMATAGSDDAKYQAGFQTLKKVCIALWGIGVSRMIISLIFWVVEKSIG